MTQTDTRDDNHLTQDDVAAHARGQHQLDARQQLPTSVLTSDILPRLALVTSDCVSSAIRLGPLATVNVEAQPLTRWRTLMSITLGLMTAVENPPADELSGLSAPIVCLASGAKGYRLQGNPVDPLARRLAAEALGWQEAGSGVL